MKNKLIGKAGEGTKATKQKTFAIIFNTGDEVVTGLKAFAEEKGLTASHFTAIGAFKNVVLGYFDWDKKDYTKILIHEQVEVLSLVGDVTLDEGKPNIHAHVVRGFYAVATIRPDVGWQANVSLTSFWRMTHGHNPASHLDPTVNRRIAELAI